MNLSLKRAGHSYLPSVFTCVLKILPYKQSPGSLFLYNYKITNLQRPTILRTLQIFNSKNRKNKTTTTTKPPKAQVFFHLLFSLCFDFQAPWLYHIYPNGRFLCPEPLLLLCAHALAFWTNNKMVTHFSVMLQILLNHHGQIANASAAWFRIRLGGCPVLPFEGRGELIMPRETFHEFLRLLSVSGKDLALYWKMSWVPWEQEDVFMPSWFL